MGHPPLRSHRGSEGKMCGILRPRYTPRSPIAVYTGSQRPRFEQRTPKNMNQPFLWIPSTAVTLRQENLTRYDDEDLR